MAGFDPGQSAGIVALAALVIKESFSFAGRFNNKRKGPPVEIDWGRIAELMDVSVQPLETCMKRVMERLDDHADREAEQSARTASLMGELLIEQRKFNDLFLRFISRQEGLEEGRRHREPN